MKSALPILLCLAFAMSAAAATMHLEVAAGDGHGHVRTTFVYGQCGGKNQRPAVHWRHWIVIDLPSSLHGLDGKAALPPPARSLRNDFGNTGWDGPCPPAGDPPHHYVFTLYALDTARLPVANGASHRELRQALRRHALASASSTLLYGR
jgi:hypothetical protein